MIKPILLLAAALLTPLAGLGAAEPGAAPPAAAGTLVVRLDGGFALRPAGGLLFGGQETSLFDATMLLHRALREPEQRLVLDLSNGFAPGLAAAEELAAVLRGRGAGRKVACLVDNLDDQALVVAAACDEVVMVESGRLMVDGLAADSDYYADALNRFGVKFHAVTSGAAKTAPETLTQSGPSQTAIKEREQLVHGMDRVLRELGTRGRLDAAALKAARAKAPQTPEIAKAAGLVDSTAEPGAWLQQQPAPIRHLREQRETPDLSTFAGLTAFWAELMQGERRAKHPRMVAVVELEGTILDGDVSAPGYSICGNDTAALFDRLAGDAAVVAAVVRINSGGGSADASDRMHYALRRLSAAKPVVVLFDAVAASGGYYVGCAGREIMVHRGTITGSIGVFAVVPDLEGTRALFGIRRHTIATDPRADLFESAGFGPEKEAGYRQVVAAVDARFQGIVAERRKLTPEKVHELAGGRVYTGDEAVLNGLADRLGDLPTAVARARELAGITEALPLERLPRSGGLAARLGLGGVSAGLAAAGVSPTALPPELLLWWRVAQARRLAVMAWAPLPGIR